VVDGERRRVLITGAGGTIGTVLRRRLRERYQLRLLAHEEIDEPAVIADISDGAAIRPAFEGIDVVLHLAAAANVDSTWDQLLAPNVVGAYNVFEAARAAGVRRVVFASSTHAVGMHGVEAAPELYRLDDERVFSDEVALRPDSLYGASKAFGEILGRYFSERHGMSVICLRVGFVSPAANEAFRSPRELPERQRAAGPRAGAIWLSHRDCAALFAAAIDAQPALKWAVAYGTSDNPRQVWDLSSARRLLGYHPRDRAPS